MSECELLLIEQICFNYNLSPQQSALDAKFTWKFPNNKEHNKTKNWRLVKKSIISTCHSLNKTEKKENEKRFGQNTKVPLKIKKIP